MAYQSDKSGQMQVYVTTYPEGKYEKLISPEGGTDPQWGSKDRELFYLNGDRLMSVEIYPGATLDAGKPKSLIRIDPSFFRHPNIAPQFPSYGVMPDGRFVFVKRTQWTPVTQVILIQNWFEELKRLCPTGKK